MRILVGAIVCLFCSLTIFFGYFQQRQAAIKTIDWPTVQGVITSTKVVEHRNRNSDNYEPVVRYKYHVSGEDYESDQVFSNMAAWYGDREGAEDFIAKYPNGKEVTVSYSPRSPQHSVLEPGVSQNLWDVAFGGFLFLGGSLFLFALWRRRAA